MNWHVPDNERRILRELAARQAEYAALPVMEHRRRLWRDLNDGVPGDLSKPRRVVEIARREIERHYRG